MPKLILTLEIVTPLLMNGADQTPEIRTASFRGVFRYWLRAVLGGVYQGDIAALQEAESHYFGSTDMASPLRVQIEHRLVPTNGREKYVLPPTVKNKQNQDVPYTHKGFHESGAENPLRFQLILDTHPLYRPLDVFNRPLYATLLLAFHMGAFGKRARRGGGVLRVVRAEADWDDSEFQQFRELSRFQPETSAELQRFFNDDLIPFTRVAQSSIEYVVNSPYSNNHLPKYPVWMPEHVKVLVKGQGYNNNPNEQSSKPQPEFYEGYRRALQDLWKISGNLHHIEGAWGYAKRDGRRASAVHIRVQKSTSGAYYPLITMFRSGNSNEKWNHLENLDQTLQTLQPDEKKYLRLDFCQGAW